MAEKPTIILLIRHGVNDWIGSGKLPGRTPGVHLNERGLEEAAALAERLAAAPIKAVYSSPLERAQETAAPLANRLGLPVLTLDGVAETNCGEWTGQVIEDLAKTDLWRQVQTNPSNFRFPGGESMLDIQYRAVAALNQVREAHPGEMVAVVSHADVIKLLVAYYMGMHLDLFQRIVINPASITEIVFAGIPHLLRSNDCAHVPPEPAKEETAESAQTEPAEQTAATPQPSKSDV